VQNETTATSLARDFFATQSGIMLTPLAVLLILISPAVGSFLGVLVDRLPQREDVLVTPSACRSCAHRLHLRDLIPLLSYLAQRGRCRHCAAPIPRILPLIETASLLIALCVVALAQSDLQMLLGALFLWLLLALGATDATCFRLPDPLTIALGVVGLALAVEDPNRTLWGAALAALIASGVFWGVRIGYAHLRGREGLGFGDVKLMAGIGAGCGLAQIPLVVLIAALGALAFAAGVALIRKRALSATTALPFGSFLCLSAGLIWLASL
jgi:leader peptidase (prepilin peptidase)/N-methyltransferase